ncbi:LlaJI family restriction endonuclease, partial [Campylobacter jejuni]|nr:LlaJI family restriction endonuclease [Campylobacter jejuni]
AFLMPYNKQNNKFNTKIDSDFKNIGKATIKWKNHENYATIQGILVDTRFLIYNYDKISIADKEKLAKAISDSKF